MWAILRKGVVAETLGLLPFMLDEADPRPAREQFDANYRHGGGWCSMSGFELRDNELLYPQDPPLHALAETWLRDERIVLFQCAFVAIIQPDGAFEVSRMD